MMLAVLVFGGGFGWSVASARRQTETVAMIKRLGGFVMYDWAQHDGVWYENTAEPPYPDWLIDRVGMDFLCNVTCVGILSPEDRDLPPGTPGWPKDGGALARRIGEFRHLEVLDVQGNKEVDDGLLARFSGLGQIRTLDIGETSVTGAGLIHLAGMAKLEDLTLDGLPIRDADLARLSGLTSFKTLWLPGEHLTDAGLAHLGSLTNLEELHIDAKGHPSAITSKGLAHLAGLRKLKTLDIIGSKVESLESIRNLTGLGEIRIRDSALEDGGLGVLSGFVELGRLDLDGNPKITDAVLAHLAELKQFRELSLSGTGVTTAGIDSLRATLKARRPRGWVQF